MTADPWLEKAHRSARTASIALADGDADAACNRAYYAMFNAARAALLAIGQDELAMAKTHAGLVAAFGEHLVKAGHLPADQGRALAIESKRRMVSDYEGGGVSTDDARVAIAHASVFLSAVSNWIEARA